MYESRLRLADRFQVIEAVAHIGEHVVWSCRDLHTGSGHAVTVIQIGSAEPREVVARLLPKLDAVAHLAHPHLIPADSIVNGTDWIAVVTRALPADDLSSLLRNHQPLPPAQVALFGAQLSDALAAVHALGLTHGHLSPPAIRLEPDASGSWAVRVAGFGLADLGDAFERDHAQHAASGIDHAYMAPELLGDEFASAAADVYAVGVMMCEALTGCPPARTRQAGNPCGRAAMRSLPTSAPPDLLRLVSACLEGNPRDRPTASYLASRLPAFTASTGVVLTGRAASPPRTPRRRRRHAAVSAIAIAAGAVSAVAVATLGSGGARSDAVASAAPKSATWVSPDVSQGTSEGVPTATSPLPHGIPADMAPTTPVSPPGAALPAGASLGGGRPLVNAQSGECLDTSGSAFINGAKEEIWTCNGSIGQAWSFSVGALTVDRGAYCLDVYGDQTADGSRVTLWTCDGGENQQWTLNASGNIIEVRSGKCLDVTDALTARGTQVELWTCNGGRSQQWSW